MAQEKHGNAVGEYGAVPGKEAVGGPHYTCLRQQSAGTSARVLRSLSRIIVGEEQYITRKSELNPVRLRVGARFRARV